MENKTKYDLEARLIAYAVKIIELIENMPKSKAGSHLAGQVVRSGTSVALNYGEAQSAESRKDFIHKIKVALKELRETSVCLKIIASSKLAKNKVSVEYLINETDELVSIFFKSIKTAQKNIARNEDKP